MRRCDKKKKANRQIRPKIKIRSSIGRTKSRKNGVNRHERIKSRSKGTYPQHEFIRSDDGKSQIDPRDAVSSPLIPDDDNDSNDETSEEKNSIDDNEIASILENNNGSVIDGGDQWEIVSEKSASTIVISISGSRGTPSFRSASPSSFLNMGNNFVLTEATGENYIEHVVLPTDTLQGLCLAYKLSATRLRMENNFSGNSLQMAPKKLRIPILANAGNASRSSSTKGMMIRTQDKSTKQYKLYAFMAEVTSMESVEAKAYLDLSNWDLEDAIRCAREDLDWNLKRGESFDGGDTPSMIFAASPRMEVVAKPKALTAREIFEVSRLLPIKLSSDEFFSRLHDPFVFDSISSHDRLRLHSMETALR